MNIVVLMSTWNGERYVLEQLRSILLQLPDTGKIFVRDDGSTDATVELVRSLRDARIEVIVGANLGFARSFFKLLDLVPPEADIVMLSDQDDVWLPQKIERATAHLNSSLGRPTLYCSPLHIVDSELRKIGPSPRIARGPSFENALVENVVTGCTIAMNREALRLLQCRGNETLIYFHDWWIYLVVSAFGRVLVDTQPTILYRQHANNAIGMGFGIGRINGIFGFLKRRNWVHIMFDQISNFRAVYGVSLGPSQRRHLDRYFDSSSPVAVFRLLLAPRTFRQTMLYECFLRALILTNLICFQGLRSRA